jgi:type VI secretion system secreted protein VgrG
MPHSLTIKGALVCLLALALPASAWSTTILGAAAPFTVLGGSTVTNTGPTTVFGDIGVAPGAAITGLDFMTLYGAASRSDAAAAMAHASAVAAGDYLSSLMSTQDLTGLDLGGMTLMAGIYRLSSSAQLTGTLLLDAQHDSNALFVFQIGTSLTTAADSAVAVINGGADTGVFFDVGTSAVLGTGSQFVGNLIANESITMNTSASLLCGRAVALNGAVTLDSNMLSNDCTANSLGTASNDFDSQGFAGVASVTNVPEPASVLMTVAGLGVIAAIRRRRAAWFPAA